MIEAALAQCYSRVISAVQVIEKLIEIERDLREEPDDGLTPKKITFYDARAQNGNATAP